MSPLAHESNRPQLVTGLAQWIPSLRPGDEAQGSTCAICTGPRGTQPQWTHKRAEKGKASPPTSFSLVHLPQSWLAQWTYTEGCTLPSVQSWIREAAVPGRHTCLSAHGSVSPPPAGMPGTEVSGTHLLPGGSCAREILKTSQISAGYKPLGHPRTAEEMGEG